MRYICSGQSIHTYDIRLKKVHVNHNLKTIMGIFYSKHKDDENCLLSRPYTGPKMFWAGANFFLPDQLLIFILCRSQTYCARPKDDFHSVNFLFYACTKFFGAGLNAIKFLM